MQKLKRKAIHKRVRKNVVGIVNRPRVSIFKSNQHIYAQVIDDVNHITITSESDLKITTGTKTERATIVGENLAKKAIDKKVKTIVFDRGGFKYHGRVASLAEGLRKGGLEF